jgi:hypothetical protein
MENRPDPPLFGGGVMRAVGPAIAQAGIVYQPSEATSRHLRDLAAENEISDIELVKLGLALAEILTKAKRDGNRLAVVNRDGRIVHELIGV